MARRAVEGVLRNQLRDEVTGILLNSDLALRQQALAPEVAARLQSVRLLAEKMRSQLQIS